MKQVNNQRGMSITGVLMALGLTGLLNMIVISMVTLNMKSQTTAVANSDIMAMINQIRSGLEDPAQATTMLKGNPVVGDVTVADPLVPGTILAEAGLKPNQSLTWSVKRVGFENVQATASKDLFRLSLVVIIEKNAQMVLGSSINRRVIGDVYCFVKGSKIDQCVGSSNPIGQAKIHCVALGGQWDDKASFGSQCGLKIGLNKPTDDSDRDEDKKDDDKDEDKDYFKGEDRGDDDKKPCKERD